MGKNENEVNAIKDRRKLYISFGDILILVSLIIGVSFQYLTFSNRMSEFEGFTKARIESIEKEMTRIGRSLEEHVTHSWRTPNHRNGTK